MTSEYGPAQHMADLAECQAMIDRGLAAPPPTHLDGIIASITAGRHSTMPAKLAEPLAAPPPLGLVATNAERKNALDVIAQAVRSGRNISAGIVADEIVGALAAAGYAIVPVEPTAEIEGAGASFYWAAQVEASRVRP